MRAVSKWAFLLISLGVAAGSVSLFQISSDPYTNPTSQHQTQVEPDTFAFGTTIVSAFQVGRFFNGGASNLGWATSTDGGLTWINGFLPGLTIHSAPPGPYARASDPSVAYDAAHDTWMISSLAVAERANGTAAGVAVLASLSTDGGLTWSEPYPTVANGNWDKNWIACDNNRGTSPYYGYCYTTWDDVAERGRLKVSISSDGGKTWGEPKTTANNAAGLGGIPVIQPDGTVIIPALSNSANAILAFRSTDGGESWSSTIRVSEVIRHGVASRLRALPLPSVDIDGDGNVYVVWHDARFRPNASANDIVMSTSTDGMNWTPVTRIPIDPLESSADHFLPGLAVNPMTSREKAHLLLTYHYYPQTRCDFATCQVHVAYVSSIDGGETWSEPTQLAGPMSLSWLPNTSQGYMVGDYHSTSFVGNVAFPVFANANPRTSAGFDQFMVTTAAGLDPTRGMFRAGRRVSRERPIPNAVSDIPAPREPLTAR